MSWLVVLRPVREEMPFEPTDEESRVISLHYEYLKQLRAHGRLVLAGPSALPGDSFGLGIFDQDDRADVEAIVAADPAVTSGIMTAEIRPYRISVR
ncbi:MAG TPA: YciI family protein [Gaiellaceae bacterium]|nr:YciI family protein [Gaiellaceae bacterium]